ncbi:MAG: carboxypeptidase-like regulatory domain-containing protein [Bacteroidia bacterium]
MKKALLLTSVLLFVVLDLAPLPGTRGAGSGCNKPKTGKLMGIVSFHGLPCQPGQPDFNVPPCTGPYPNYKVEVFKANDEVNPQTSATTDARGYYSIELPAGEYIVFSQNGPKEENRLKHQVHLEAGANASLDISVKTGIQ